MQDFYFTFKYGQSHFPGHVKITADDQQAATALMNKHYDDQWHGSHAQLTDIEPVDHEELAHITQTESKAELLAQYSSEPPEVEILYH